jgi:hypothetical protein
MQPPCTAKEGRLLHSGNCLGAGQTQIYILVPQLFCIFVLNNKGKPRCKRLNLKSCQVSLWQLEDELILKGGGDVMGIIGSGHHHAVCTRRKGKNKIEMRELWRVG